MARRSRASVNQPSYAIAGPRPRAQPLGGRRRRAQAQAGPRWLAQSPADARHGRDHHPAWAPAAGRTPVRARPHRHHREPL